MSQDDGTDERDGVDGDGPDLAGLSVEEAADVVVDRPDTPDDPEAVRATLQEVAQDGVVTQESVDDALAHLAKVVSTPETRAEFAGLALDDAREATEDVSDLDIVSSTLSAYEERLDDVERRAGELSDDLQDALDSGDVGDFYAVAEVVRRLTAESNAVQKAADDLKFDLEHVETWADTPTMRYDELGEEVDELESSLSDLDRAVDVVADENPGAVAEGVAVAELWAEATLRHRMTGLLADDLRSDLADLREWDAREGTDDEGRLDEIEGRLDDLGERRSVMRDRLDDLARPAWRERYGDRLAAFESDLASISPPVEWGAVHEDLEAHLSAIQDSR